MLRRHPILVTCVLLLTAGAIALAIALATFDLDHYRSDLEQTLSSALARPVQLGHARFALHGGIALEFNEVRIGEDAEHGLITARRLALRLELLPLIIGRFTFNRLLIDQPDIQLTLVPLPSTTAAATVAPATEIVATLDALLKSTLVRTLNVSAGRLRVSDRRHPGEKRLWEIDEFALHLRNLGHRGPIEIDGSGNLRLGATPTPFRINGSLDLPGTLQEWRNGAVDVTANAGPFGPELATFLGLRGPHGQLEGSATLALHFSGVPATGLDFSGEVLGNHAVVTLPALYRAPLPLERLRLEGRWTTAEAQEQLELHGTWNGLRIGSRTRWLATPAGRVAEISLSLPATPLTELATLLPDAILPGPLRLLQRSLRGGTLAIPTLQFNLTPPPTVTDAWAIELRRCIFLLRNGAMDLPGVGPAEQIDLTGQWQSGALRLTDGTAAVANGTLRFGGTVGAGKGEPIFDLTVAGELGAAPLCARLAATSAPGLVASGQIPLHGTLKGPSGRLFLDLQADLTPLELLWGRDTLKRRRDPGSLLVAGALTPQQLELNHLLLAMPLAEVRASGNLGREAPYPAQLNIELTRLDLARYQTNIAVLKLLRPRGDISGRLVLERDQTGSVRRGGEISFHNLSLHLGGAVADVSEASGRILVSEDDLRIEHVSGRVGNSLLSGSGSLGRPEAIRLDLNVHGETIRPRDLVFRSEQALLRSVSGRLIIDGDGIDFIDVHADLGDGTRGVVNGKLRNYAAPTVELDVVAEKAVVADVVNLWQGPPPPSPATPAPLGAHGTGVQVTVRAVVRKGDIYGLAFSDGEGLIVYRDGRLTVSPLRLKSGAGHGTGQLVVRDLHAHAQLSISGHLVNADAAGVYNQLLKRPGLITGTLSGDFHLAGQLGNFTATSTGGGSARIDNGVLLRFPVLAKVFSVLNVSQIFTLRLPDMAQEGMPVDRLEGTFTLDQGRLRTEDLVVDSPAMNLALVGTFDLNHDRLDCVLGVKPLRTVDKIVSSIPLAGWVLTGKEKALVTAQFTIQGSSEEPEVKAAPISTISDLAVGFFKRAFGLPGKMIEDIGALGSGQ